MSAEADKSLHIFAMTEETTEVIYEDGAIPCDKTDIQMLGKIFLPVLYGLVFTIGMVGNFLVVLTILKARRQKSITDIFFLNLAISDLLFVISLPFWASYIIRDWRLGNFTCKMVSSFYSVGYFSGMFFITIISIDRYLAIVRATCIMKSRTVTYGHLISISIWALAVFFASPHFIFMQESDRKCTSSYPEHLHIIWPVFSYLEMNVIGFLLPMCIMSYCYLQIIRTLLSCKNQCKQKAMKVISLVVIVFFLFWTPYHLSLFLQVLRYFEVFKDCSSLRSLDYTVQVTETVAFSHCCLNPIIYVFAGEKFRKYLSRLVLKCISFTCACGYCGKYSSGVPTAIPDCAMTSNHTQNTSDREMSLLL
ncbi:CX3C chemokine receptor 1 isoform X1 [Pseudonaja textilis]|uniref:CX3C chemokine receptor 1 isoform X1 n=2 Tax=Pseudonaja textilis TaxID=8673 RepID=UPI000EAA0FA6|nr:CX3C chemokine receptor 1 isoform X1 [Pseudonaja textilis]XP_026573525.1 CX3C chemokine receptor 1 isoform X1 [Pseudonaja textilis]